LCILIIIMSYWCIGTHRRIIRERGLKWIHWLPIIGQMHVCRIVFVRYVGILCIYLIGIIWYRWTICEYFMHNIRAIISIMMNILYKRHFGITLVNVSFFKTAVRDSDVTLTFSEFAPYPIIVLSIVSYILTPPQI